MLSLRLIVENGNSGIAGTRPLRTSPNEHPTLTESSFRTLKVAKAKRTATETSRRKSSSRSPRSWARRSIGWLALVVLVILVLPYLLVPLYALKQIRPVSTLMLAETLTGRSYQRQWVDFDAIAPVLVQSVMMSEDGQFCAHSGIDWEALNLVIEEALDGEATRGASTIPMQTAKNLFLPPTRSAIRKALEIPIAMWMDVVWSKRRLMEIYLNIAEWAPGVYGVEAAAQAYFGVPASKLSARQSALLAVTLPNPIKRNAANPSRGMRRLAGIIEARARQSGAYIKCLYD
jgi:monofunctional biosynthetic peptidoglycan transglycosylase